MRDGSIICKGKGNSYWNNFASHGACDYTVVLRPEKSYLLKNLNVRWKESTPHQLKRKHSENLQWHMDQIDSILNNVEDTLKIIGIVKPLYNLKA